ncbi:MAG: DUF4190 domain-containing protein [Planctomycetota bacterium]|jgi:competence protein ComGC
MGDHEDVRAHAAPRQTSGLAIASLVLGILGLLSFGLTSFLGLILAITALVKIGNSRGRLGGQGMAVAGGVISGLFLLIVPVSAWLMLPALAAARERARRVRCASNLKMIGYGLHLYASDHDEKFPKSLEELTPKYVEDPKVFVCPSNPGGQGYVYVKGLDAACPPQCALAHDKEDNHDGMGGNVLFVGSNVAWIRKAQFQQVLGGTKKFLEARRKSTR